jgi:hypothetical protein
MRRLTKHLELINTKPVNMLKRGHCSTRPRAGPPPAHAPQGGALDPYSQQADIHYSGSLCRGDPVSLTGNEVCVRQRPNARNRCTNRNARHLPCTGGEPDNLDDPRENVTLALAPNVLAALTERELHVGRFDLSSIPMAQ